MKSNVQGQETSCSKTITACSFTHIAPATLILPAAFQHSKAWAPITVANPAYALCSQAIGDPGSFWGGCTL
jgi:hypothetical protein